MQTKSVIKIEHLFCHKQLIGTVAQWIYNEFWSDRSEYSVEQLRQRLSEAKTANSIPISLIAFCNSTAAGTINLVENDNDSFPHLSPWLAALYVDPQFRKTGVGSGLVMALLQIAKDFGCDKLYLGTDNPEYYFKLGAKKYVEQRPGFFIMYFDVRSI